MALTRSQVMSRIRGRNTAPEQMLRSAVWARGLRYRLHTRTPVGRPDLVFAGRKVAIFIDGCFWHGCPEHYVSPRSRRRFWSAKLRENVERDRKQTLQLEASGWRVCRLWECDVVERLNDAAGQVERAVAGQIWKPSASWRTVRVVPLPGGGDRERRDFQDLRDEKRARNTIRKRSTRKARAPRNSR